MTWTCDICKRERPDKMIQVLHKPLRGFENMFPDARFNLKFCVDDLDCITTAHASSVWPPAKENVDG